jgi:hypothetical protein
MEPVNFEYGCPSCAVNQFEKIIDHGRNEDKVDVQGQLDNYRQKATPVTVSSTPFPYKCQKCKIRFEINIQSEGNSTSDSYWAGGDNITPIGAFRYSIGTCPECNSPKALYMYLLRDYDLVYCMKCGKADRRFK